jgi:hypothetical protein
LEILGMDLIAMSVAYVCLVWVSITDLESSSNDIISYIKEEVTLSSVRQIRN